MAGSAILKALGKAVKRKPSANIKAGRSNEIVARVERGELDGRIVQPDKHISDDDFFDDLVGNPYTEKEVAEARAALTKKGWFFF